MACVALVDRLRDLAPSPPVVLGRVEGAACDEIWAVWEGVNDGLRLCEEETKRSVIGVRGNDRRFLMGVLE